MKKENDEDEIGYLDDQVSDEDEFDCHAHQNVADALADFIKKDTQGGITIGLEGGWGSGKSTVVHLFKKNIEKETNFKVFIFDAWAHESDPLRRTFLERLIDDLEKWGWIIEDDKKENKDKLTGQESTSLNTSTPVITKLGNCVIVSSLLIPIGLILLNKAISIGVEFKYSSNINFNWYFIFGMILSLLPVFIILIASQYLRGVNLSDVWGSLIQKYTITTKTFTTTKPNPTSVEFETIFKDLLGLVYTNYDGNRKLIIILDNIDRIDRKEGLSLLSTVQTLLECNSLYRKNLWIIIPYDKNHINQLWEKDEKQKNLKDVSRIENESEKASEKTYHKSNNDNLPKLMLDKRFQVRFYVPVLLFSAWRKYFQEKLRSVCTTRRPEEYLNTYLIFCKHSSDMQINPRDIKIFINQLKLLHNEWKDIPLNNLAYFIHLKRSDDRIFENQNNSIDIDPIYIPYLENERISQDISQINSNIKERGVSIQQHLAGNIQSAVKSTSKETLKSIYEGNKASFWEAFEYLLIQIWTLEDFELLANSASLLKDSGLLEQIPQGTSDAFRLFIKKIPTISYLNKNIGNGITAWMDLISQEGKDDK